VRKRKMAENNLLDYYIQQAVIQAGAGTQYQVTFSEDCKQPTFNGKTITLPILGVGATRDDIEQQRAFVHRCTAYGRHGEGKRTPILKQKNPNDKLTQLFHQTDDTRCEKLEAADYAGVYNTLVSAEGGALKMLFKQLSALDQEVFNDDRASRELAQLAAHTMANASWNPSSRDYLDRMAKLYRGTHTGNYLTMMLDDKDIHDNLDSEDAEGSYKAALAMYNILYKDQKGEGEGTGDHDKPGKKPGTGALGESKEGDPEYGEGVSDEAKEMLKRLLTEYKDFDYKPGGTPNPVVISYENRSQTATKCPIEAINQVNVYDFVKQRWPGSPRSVEYYNPGNSGDVDRASAAFANRVRSLLQIKSQAYYTHGHSRGKISSKRIYRIAMPDVGDGSWNQRIYKRRHQDRVLDLAVSIMIDVSGSMACTKTYWTYKGCVLLNDTMSRILHVPTEIACFNTDSNTNIGILKPYTGVISSSAIKERFGAICGHMTGNNDSTALLWAASRLAVRREKRKVLIMLSDGQPSAGGYGDADYMLRHAVKAVEQRPDMELYSVGIEYNGVKHFYKNWSEVKTGLDIEEALLKVLSKALNIAA
jgi:hypothetical protein